MKIPLNWLKEYVDIDISVDELVKRLTAIGHMQDKLPESVAGDTVLDLEVRQNRADCLSIIGIAKEVAAVTGKKIKKYKSIKIEKKKDEKLLKIINESTVNCIRFSAYKIAGINTSSKTPVWMKKRLEAYGMKTICPVVDITNFVMIETGEPMHAFDSGSVPDGIIKIRQAKKGESLTVLGDKTISLTEDDLIVTDANDAPISFSGLIGGATSGIKEDSKEIIVEAATYNQAVIRRSSIRHSIRTEASTRHEKFLHPEMVSYALERALSLIVDICGGEIVAYDDNYPHPLSVKTLSLRLGEVTRLGGVKMNIKEISDFLGRFDFQIKSQDETQLEVIVPIERTDITGEVDLVEEVIRLYGYENIPGTYPSLPPAKNITSKFFEIEEKCRDHLLSLGFSEEITEPLIPVDHADSFVAVKLQNALNSEKSTLRTSLKTGLQNACFFKKKYAMNVIKIFEIGKIYSKTNDSKYLETRMVALLIHDMNHHKEVLSTTVKGIAQSLFQNVLGQKTPENTLIHVIDDHTVFVEFEIQFPESSFDKSERFYKDIPHYSDIDVSFAVDTKVDLSEVANYFTSQDHSLEGVTWETNTKLAPKGEIFVLFKMRYANISAPKEEKIAKICESLKQEYKARIR